MAGEFGVALKNNTKKQMPREELEALIKKHMSSVRMGMLSTTNNVETRATPLEYFVEDMTIYISPDPGTKLRNLKVNQNACLSVCNILNPEWEKDWDKVWGLQITGTATVYEYGCPEWEHGSEVIKVDAWMRALGATDTRLPPKAKVIRIPISKINLTEYSLLLRGYTFRQVWRPDNQLHPEDELTIVE